MQIIKGIPVSPGVAIQEALVLDAEDQPVPRRVVPEHRVQAQLEQLNRALHGSVQEIEELRNQTARSLGPDLGKIFSFHLGMLADEHLIGQIRDLITTEHVTSEYAVFETMRRLAKAFLEAESRYLRERVSDVWDLERRILRHLIGEVTADLHKINRPTALIAHDLTPSQTASLDKQHIRAIATDAGGRTSHTAILAHALGIPAVVGLEKATTLLSTGDQVIIDGNRGLIVVDPDAAKLMEYRQELRRMALFEQGLDELKDLPAVTKDGAEIELLANIEFPSEIRDALDRGAAGIGLYRTEFLYLAAETPPDEDEQYETYAEALRVLDGRPLTIRTLDLGADKIPMSRLEIGFDSASERNPFLGVRSIRLCLQNLPLFKTQLRAILRASTEGDVRIMFPLISHVMELRQARMILQDVMEDLDERDIPYRQDIPVGMMIEVPSAALQARTFAREVDFFSIGTNDLIQYTLAVDRSNERIASLYSGAHPAVIALVRDVVRAAKRAGIAVSLCGELAGELEYATLLLGLGLRKLSITPPAIPEIKRVIRSIKIAECERIARKAAGFDSEREVLNYLREQVRKVAPEVFDGRSIEV